MTSISSSASGPFSAPKEKSWALTDHIHKSCGGRILRCLSGAGPSPGGNPLYKCADCGESACSMGPDSLCWCGFHHRKSVSNPYRCVSSAVAKTIPGLKEAMLACGCDPNTREVGVVLSKSFDSIVYDHYNKPPAEASGANDQKEP